MSTTIKTKLTRYIYNINGDKIKKIKGVFDQNSCSGGVIMINPSQPIPKDSHHKSQDIITSFEHLKPVGNKRSHILTL